MSDLSADRMLVEILAALGGGVSPAVELTAGGSLPSAFAVSDLAQAAVAAAGAALSAYSALSQGGAPAPVRVDRTLASAWFASSIAPVGWRPDPVWDPIAGDYAGTDGWIRLHTNAPHHRAAALSVLGVAPDRDAVSAAVAQWAVADLESAVVAAGGASAVMQSAAGWIAHPAGAAVTAEPLLWVQPGSAGALPAPTRDPRRPLAGIRVLDLTRIIAGPVATRTLAGWGAEVLRIDPLSWDEGAYLADLNPGKRTARLDLTDPGGLDTLKRLLAGADVLVHGYRADALDRLDLGWAQRQDIRPGLVDVSLNAYGWTGPWVNRRGFDSLVQMSSGIADTGRSWAATQRPTPLPVQALDHASGYILAGAAIAGLSARLHSGAGSRWRGSLARTATLLLGFPGTGADSGAGAASAPEPRAALEPSAWGDVVRLAPPVEVEGAPLWWSFPARQLGSDPPAWS